MIAPVPKGPETIAPGGPIVAICEPICTRVPEPVPCLRIKPPEKLLRPLISDGVPLLLETATATCFARPSVIRVTTLPVVNEESVRVVVPAPAELSVITPP